MYIPYLRCTKNQVRAIWTKNITKKDHVKFQDVFLCNVHAHAKSTEDKGMSVRIVEAGFLDTIS